MVAGAKRQVGRGGGSSFEFLSMIVARCSDQGRHADGAVLHRQALAFFRRVLPAEHPDIATAMLNTANSYSALGRHAEALDFCEQALAIFWRVLPADHPNIALAMQNAATIGCQAESLNLKVQALVQTPFLLSEAQAAAEEKIGCILINLMEQEGWRLNGFYEPAEERQSGRRVYVKHGDASMCLEFCEGFWRIKLSADKGKPAPCFATCMNDFEHLEG